jgi:hypothetical protein
MSRRGPSPLGEQFPIPFADGILPVRLPPWLRGSLFGRQPELNHFVGRGLLVFAGRTKPVVIVAILDQHQIFAVVEIGRLGKIVRAEIDRGGIEVENDKLVMHARAALLTAAAGKA